MQSEQKDHDVKESLPAGAKFEISMITGRRVKECRVKRRENKIELLTGSDVMLGPRETKIVIFPHRVVGNRI